MQMAYDNREPKEDTGAVQTFNVTAPDDADIDLVTPDLEVKKEMEVDYEAAEVMALETAMINAQNEFVKSQKEQKNYPRIDVMVDKNCLISYTGHMEDFPAEEFQLLVDKTIMARIDLDCLWNERVIKGPREPLAPMGYQ